MVWISRIHADSCCTSPFHRLTRDNRFHPPFSVWAPPPPSPHLAAHRSVLHPGAVLRPVGRQQRRPLSALPIPLRITLGHSAGAARRAISPLIGPRPPSGCVDRGTRGTHRHTGHPCDREQQLTGQGPEEARAPGTGAELHVAGSKRHDRTRAGCAYVIRPPAPHAAPAASRGTHRAGRPRDATPPRAPSSDTP